MHAHFKVFWNMCMTQPALQFEPSHLQDVLRNIDLKCYIHNVIYSVGVWLLQRDKITGTTTEGSGKSGGEKIKKQSSDQ